MLTAAGGGDTAKEDRKEEQGIHNNNGNCLPAWCGACSAGCFKQRKLLVTNSYSASTGRYACLQSVCSRPQSSSSLLFHLPAIIVER
jgi:hypothetical protein